MVSTTRLLLASLTLIRTTPSTSQTNWQLLSETIISFSKKHGQLKQATTKLVQMAMCYLHAPGNAPTSVVEPPKEEDTKMEEAAKIVDSNAKDGAAGEGEKKKTEREKDREAKQLEKEREGKEAVEVTKLMDEARRTGDVGLDKASRRKLVETLRQVTEGKVSVCAGDGFSKGPGGRHILTHFTNAPPVPPDLRRSRAGTSHEDAVLYALRGGQPGQVGCGAARLGRRDVWQHGEA